MTHTEAVAASPLNFAIRNNMLYGGEEQFLRGDSDTRYYRLLIENASCFKDWEPVTERGPLEALRPYYPYVVIPERVQGQVQGQKTHGRKAKV